MELDVVAARATTLALVLDRENSSSVKLPPSYVVSPPEDDVDWDLSPAGCPPTLRSACYASLDRWFTAEVCQQRDLAHSRPNFLD
jgi:hypothetical protein